VPGAPGRDVAAHGAGADDVHVAAGKVAVGEALELFAQEEHAHEIARGIRDDESRERRDLGPLHVLRVAAVPFPQIDQRVGGGVMRDRRLLLRFRAHARGGELAAVGAVDQRAEHASAPLLQLSRNGGGGGGLDVALGHDRVDEAKRLGAAGAHVPPGEHHGHGLERIDQPRQAHRAAEPGMQAEHDLGKSERRVLDRDAMVAGERDFEPAAEAIAVHDRDRRRRQAIEPVDHRVRLDQARLDGAGVGHGAKFTDVGAGDEALRLGGAQHQAFGHVALEAREHVVELAEHVLGERIGAGVRLVEREPGDAVLVAREYPVAPGRGRALVARERTELEIARRENVPDFTHLEHLHWC
jgi:hypothetical protein